MSLTLVRELTMGEADRLEDYGFEGKTFAWKYAMVLPPDQNLDEEIAEAVAKESELGKQMAEVAETQEGDVEEAELAEGVAKSPSEESSSATTRILDYTEVKDRWEERVRGRHRSEK